MPNKIPLDRIELKLPKFVKIIPNSYRGIRYEAEFIDIEFNEPFKAIVSAVIKHQHGCKKRSDLRRSHSYGKRITLEQFKAKLPSYIKIYDGTWRGLRNKAKFKDIEYNEDFESYCCNVVRSGKGYCESRRLYEFRKAILIPVHIIQERIDKFYGVGYANIIPETYKGTNEIASFIVKDKGVLRYTIDLACQGGLDSTRCKCINWANRIKEIDNNICQISGETKNLETHHIFNKATYPHLRFNELNGILLCKKLHIQFHSIYGYKNTNKEQLIEFGQRFNVDLTQRLSTCPIV